MSEPLYDMVAIGNALVDVLAHATEEFVAEQDRQYNMKKGTMSLIDEVRAVALYAQMGTGIESSGGSAGNTMAGFASFGGKGAYIGKVASDQLGDVFRHDMKAQGVTHETAPLAVGAPTGRCLILVTPDGQRTMNTFLGASVEMGVDDIDSDLIASARITYLEGYLYDREQAKRAFQKAGEIAHDAGHRVALTLSDPFCVDRHRADFQYLVENHVDILFANEDEIKSLYEVENFEQAAKIVSGKCEISALTRSEKGSVVISGDQIIEIPPQKAKVVDTTGAGDQYAAGFLYGFTQGMDMKTCGLLGTLAATEVISHMGPRPEIKYADLVAQAKAA
ncbi:MAG: adenosine kinase [Alphaproteobacteria bacterium CG_4_9_14_3_um_filter_47_13]|nr:MAG: adenosine kinase [Alphaproteobacteria bacterium CG_4_9_14_3_um_filter_47_13]